MNPISEYRAYSSLSAEQKEFVTKKQIESERSPAEWLEFATGIAKFDTVSDSLKKTAKIGCAISGALFFIGIFLIAVFVGFFMIAIGLLAGIVLMITLAFLAKVDLHNNFRECVFPLLSVLREEMTEGERLYLKLDFRGKTSSEKELLNARRSATGRQEQFYHDEWMIGRATLADGTRLDLRVVDLVRKRKQTKRSRSGKTKTKTKYKIKTMIEAKLGLKQDDYAAVSDTPLKSKSESVDVKVGDKRNAIRVRRFLLASDTNTVLDFGQVLGAIGAAYARATLKQDDEK
ncbi:MAG TPA: hypothetical protein VKM94_03855 [Blastocatellia bacterium]|nr:hypothetical protein [Blastocatellia bacterium]